MPSLVFVNGAHAGESIPLLPTTLTIGREHDNNIELKDPDVARYHARIVHERGHSFISQREVRGSDDDMVAAARAALREDPDVIMIGEMRDAETIDTALKAAETGHLLISTLHTADALSTINRIVAMFAPAEQAVVRSRLGESLHSVISQRLIKKVDGKGRAVAAEVLLNTPAVSSVIAEGKTSQLPMAIDSGRKHGMVALNDALVAFVQRGIVDSREAYRQAADQQGFLALLKRQGIDTSFVERLA